MVTIGGRAAQRCAGPVSITFFILWCFDIAGPCGPGRECPHSEVGWFSRVSKMPLLACAPFLCKPTSWEPRLSSVGLLHSGPLSLALATPGQVSDNKGQPLCLGVCWNYLSWTALRLHTLPRTETTEGSRPHTLPVCLLAHPDASLSGPVW